MPIALEKSWMPNTTCFTVEYCMSSGAILSDLGCSMIGWMVMRWLSPTSTAERSRISGAP